MRPSLPTLALLLLSSAALAAQQRNVDVLHYRFDVTIPDHGNAVRIASTVRFTRTARVDTLRLELLAPMQVSAASLGCGSAPVPAAFTHDGRVVRVLIGAPRGPGAPVDSARPRPDTLCVTVRYEGEPRDGLIISTDTAGRWRAFGDNWPDRARHWLATVDHPSDKALVEFVVLAPAALRVVSNGTQRAVTELPGRPARRRTTWATSRPIPTYLMVIAAAPLAEHDLGATACGFGSVQRCVSQRVYTAPEQARFMPGHFTEADSIVSFFARTVAPFPYEQLLHVQSSTRFGGMENAGAIFYADRLFREPNGLSSSLIAHETAHQWFGDAVTESAWGHLWLSEGFATYFAALYTEHALGDSAFRAELRRIRDEVFAAKEVAERPVLDTAQTNLLELLNTNSYQKGGLVLHMLRSEVGDSAFFRGVRDYFAGHVHRNALTADLHLAMERASGRELGWFFDQWLRRPGFAELTLSWKFDDVRGLEVVAEQGGRFAPYRISLPVELVLADGTRRMARAEIPATARSLVVVRTFGAVPTSVRFDPNADVLARIAAQRTTSRVLPRPSRALPQASPSRADSMLARGRLRAAEDALYSAVDAAPRSPSARGELGRYLASRARFTIAEVLFREALRFGADTPSISQALVAMASYTPDIDRRLIPGVRLPAAEAAREAARLGARVAGEALAVRHEERTVPFAFTRSDGALGAFEVRGPGGTRRAVLDPRARGLSVARADDAALKPRSFGARGPGAPLLIDTLWIGDRLLRGVEARVDPNVPPGAVRVGLDVLWSLQPIFDEMNGTMTLSAPGTVIRKGLSAVQVPFALGFPGMWLIPTVGEPPVALSSSRARALLGRSRWWWDGPQATLIVER